jgi:hypothetical protein
MEIETALHSIFVVADYLEQSGDASSISRDQVVHKLESGV